MIVYENDCVGCPQGCIGCGQDRTPHYYCDVCGEETDGEDICEECARDEEEDEDVR